MGKLKTLAYLIKNEPHMIPPTLWENFKRMRISHILSDKLFLKIAYRIIFGKPLRLNNPQTFNEKLQWLKLYYRKPEFTALVDKYEVKKIIADKIGEEYIIPTLGCWDSFDDIEFDVLPSQFVLKCTHDSGSMVICRDKTKLDKDAVKKKFEKMLKRNMFWWAREWPYKNVKPRILAEKYMCNPNEETESNIDVYKVMCFNGVPKIIQTIQNDKTSDETVDYFDTEWNVLHFKQNFPNSETLLEKPKHLNEMLELSKVLSEGHPFLRCDFFEIAEKIYFSELTFYSDAALTPFEPKEWDRKLGELIELPTK